MTSTEDAAPAAPSVIRGVDTHKHTHYAGAIDDQGRLLGHREFPACEAGYRHVVAWLRGHGHVQAIAVESTGSFGATLTRALTAAGESVVESTARTGSRGTWTASPTASTPNRSLEPSSGAPPPRSPSQSLGSSM